MMRQYTIAAALLIGLTAVNSAVDATIVEANGFAATTDCGAGLQFVEGFHTGILNLVGPEDKNKSWHLTGELWTCAGFFGLKQAAVTCTKTTSTNIKFHLSCAQENTIGCFQIEDGIQTVTKAGGGDLGISATRRSACVAPICDDNPIPVTDPEPSSDEMSQNPFPRYGDSSLMTDPFEVLDNSRLQTTYTGADIPMFSVVSHFFLMADSITRSSHPTIQHSILREIGVEHDSELEDFLMRLADEAKMIFGIKTVDTSLNGRAFYNHQYAALRQKAARMARVYRALLDGFTDAGVSTDELEAFLEAKIRQTVRIYSSESDDAPYFDAVREFDRELALQSQ